jgi:hypothetical protein
MEGAVVMGTREGVFVVGICVGTMEGEEVVGTREGVLVVGIPVGFEGMGVIEGK